MTGAKIQCEVNADRPSGIKPQRVSVLMRFSVRALALLLAGFVTTFAVSSCCSVVLKFDAAETVAFMDESIVPGMAVSVWSLPGGEMWVGFALPEGRSDWTSGGRRTQPTPLEPPARVQRAFRADDPESTRISSICAHGWPLHAFGYQFFWSETTGGPSVRPVDRMSLGLGGVVVGVHEDSDFLTDIPRVIGLEPLWPGVAVDTLLFAVCWAVISAAIGWLRRRVHRLSMRAVGALALASLALAPLAAIAVAIGIACSAPSANWNGHAMGNAWGRYWDVFRTERKGRVDINVATRLERISTLDNGVRSINADIRVLLADWPKELMGPVAKSTHRSVAMRGWPVLCLIGGASWPGEGVESEGQWRTHSAFVLERVNPFRDPMPPRIIPLAPIWSGLAINTAVYAPVWFVLLFCAIGPLRMLRAHRLAHGRCPRCRYLFGTAERCPECGTEIALLRSEVPESLNHA